MSSSTGLRRFVSGPPSAAQVGAAQNLRPQLPSDQGTESPGQAAIPPTAAEPEKCEVCATVIPGEHGHLADLDHSSLVCTCRACYLLFTRREAVRGRFRAVPDRYMTDPAHPLTAADWDELQIPVGLAFFLNSSRAGAVTGFYPSPAGATECRLDLAAWARLADAHPLLKAAEEDVEAVLITRSPPAGIESFVVPVDACYELTGRMRLHWRGFDGGAEARQAIGALLERVRSRAVRLDQET